jgi:gamma-glutamyltranspeptidase/glutathione hydrolase
MPFDPYRFPFPSRRYPVYAARGMVATSQNLAARAGLSMLERGGNAVDAAVATAACLTVVEPCSNGLGSDAFAMVWTGGSLRGFNGSGPSPAALDAGTVKALGHSRMPALGWIPVTVPGAVGLWELLSRRFGRLPLGVLLEPAVSYAEGGFPVSPVVARSWARALARYAASDLGALAEPWMRAFAPGGRAPRPGEIARLPDHGRSLSAIAAGGAAALYRGELAVRIDDFSRRTGGYIRVSDLAAYEPAEVEPLSAAFRDHEVRELPPNGQGIVALIALGILDRLGPPAPDELVAAHRSIEAVKLAFGVARAAVTEPDFMRAGVEELLDPKRLDELAAGVGAQASDPGPSAPERGGTVYIATADAEGSMVSFIQSNYMGFGSGLVVPGTGIALQNRGANFSLEEGHPNLLEPRKRSYHTIIPGFLFRGGEPLGAFGVMGGFMQPQGHLQVVRNLVDLCMNPQAALDAPRWEWIEGRRVLVEQGFPADLSRGLERMGHEVEVCLEDGEFGRGQIIMRTGEGSLCGACEMRADSAVFAF